MTTVIEAFPRRPIALAQAADHARRRRGWFLGVVLTFLVAAYIGYGDWQRASLRADLRDRGVEAEVLKAEGNCFSRRQLSGDQNLGCTYQIEYRLRPEHGGGVRTGEARLSKRFLVFAPPALYDPENPDRVMFKPEVEREADHVSRAIMWTILILIPGLGLLVWLATGRKALAAAAADPKPVVVAIDRAQQAPDGLDIWFEHPGSGKPAFKRFHRGSRPLFVAPPPGAVQHREYGLALLSPKGALFLLDDRLSDLVLSEEERATILNAAHG